MKVVLGVAALVLSVSVGVVYAQEKSSSLMGHLGMQLSRYECLVCGWQGCVVLKATNKKLSVWEVEIIRNAMEEKDC